MKSVWKMFSNTRKFYYPSHFVSNCAQYFHLTLVSITHNEAYAWAGRVWPTKFYGFKLPFISTFLSWARTAEYSKHWAAIYTPLKAVQRMWHSSYCIILPVTEVIWLGFTLKWPTELINFNIKYGHSRTYSTQQLVHWRCCVKRETAQLSFPTTKQSLLSLIRHRMFKQTLEDAFVALLLGYILYIICHGWLLHHFQSLMLAIQT